MVTGIDLVQHNWLIEVFGSYDETYIPIWGGSWSDYSGCGWMCILMKGNDYLLIINLVQNLTMTNRHLT